MKKFYIYSNGCSSNLLDGQRIIEYLRANDYSITNTPQEADLLIVNTCAFEQISETDSLNKLKELKKLKGKIIVTGCLPAINKEKMNEIIDCDFVTPRDENTWKKFDEIIHSKKSISTIPDPCILEYHPDWKIIGTYKAFKGAKIGKDLTGYDDGAYHIQVARGCLGACSYCAIRYARGRLRSVPIKDIITRFKKGLEKGYKSFKIWADDIGDYGKDLNTNLAELLEKMLAIKGDYELEILCTNPRSYLEIFDQLLPCLKDKRVKYLNISMQSGSEKVLEMMNRPVDVQKVINSIQKIKQEAPHVIVRTHYMVGFPQESWSDFYKTIQFIWETKVFKCVIFRFFPRPNTPAEKMDGQISQFTKKLRYYILTSFTKIGSLIYEDGYSY
ncbi:MiaB/RimO family radical SAM methylthiotransferase [Candidatus Falkowbacteria bacterium]|nr:MiaB/RimO family radical SAM methylthiotransferase [Candidatus Falkowbacteria bacterium]